MSVIEEHLTEVRRRIEDASRAAGRAPESVALLAVSKRQPDEAIREAYRLGLRAFGENYAQELVAKAERLRDLPDIAWHLIGHLQSNKARAVAPVAHVVHTVDSRHLAAELDRRVVKAGRRMKVLIEVNVAKDPAKSGCAPSELEDVIDAVRSSVALDLSGLMTMPPYTDDPGSARAYFGELRSLRNLVGGPDLLPELSMGMSHDLEAAIAEGATMVRIGTAIFGERPPAR
jgi:pyridoxal phosphate enzyme (YggS family)